MRKLLVVALLILVATLSLSSGLVAAQDIIPLELGADYTEGEITNEAFEVFYTVSGSAGDVLVVEMLPEPGTYDLDPRLTLRDSVGREIATNDDFGYGLSLIAAELPDDGNYTIVAGRYDGSSGTSSGAYWIRASVAQPLSSGAKFEVTLTSDYEARVPHVFVLKPDASGPVKVGFSQTPGDLYAGLRLTDYAEDYYSGTIFEMADTRGISEASFTVELEGGKLYILTVIDDEFVFDDEEAIVTVTIN